MTDVNDSRLFGQIVSRETFERLEIFEALVRKWNPSINLVSKSSLDHLWQRHFADSIQVFRNSDAASSWLDIGSGAGFPGSIIAILAKDETPKLAITLIESDKRKAAFLRTVARETDTGYTVLAERIEAASPQDADVISARAVAPLHKLLAYADRHLGENGQAIFPKGISWQKEVDAARQEWSMEINPIESLTETGAAILKIKGISRV